MAAPPDRVVEQLYAAPLRTFIRERDAKAAELTRAGEAEQARAVKQLRRPAISLWAINQLAHADPERLAALIDAVGRVRAAQLRDPRGAAEALRKQRADLQALVNRAGERLGGEGYRLTPAMARRISDTLLGAAVDRRLAAELRAGRLMAEVPAPGFEVLSGVARPLQLVRDEETKVEQRRVRGEETKVEQRHPPAAKTRGETEANEARRQKAEAARRAAAIAADEERARRRREAEELEREAAAREAAMQQAQREATEAAAALARARHHLREAKAAALAASAVARKARRAAT